jgi:hypothetical protein
MLIIALVLAVVGLAALVTAVVTSNELIAWVCIAASVVGVLLLIVDALRERSRRDTGGAADTEPPHGTEEFDADYPDEAALDDEVESDEDTRAVPLDKHDDDVAEHGREERNSP